MNYDFTTLPERRGTGSEKYLNMLRLDPETPEDIVPFSVADMDFLPPPELVDGLKDFLDHNVLGYTLPTDSYYETVLDWYRVHHGLSVRREWLIDGDNVIDVLRQEIRCFSRESDSVLTMTPAYPAFLSSVQATGRKLLPLGLLEKDGRYAIDFDGLERECRRPDVSILLLASPANPVGRVFTREELTELARICLENHVFIICDEIHWDLIMPGHSFVSMLDLEEPYRQNCSVSTAATKTFNMPAMKGAEVVICNEERREQLRSYLDREGVPGRGVLSYAAAEIAYKRCGGWLQELLKVLDSNRRLLEEYFADHIPEAVVYPLEGTYLQWIDFRFLHKEPKELEHFMAFEARCFFTEGYKFGKEGEGFERWSIACPQDVLLAGLERMSAAVDRAMGR